MRAEYISISTFIILSTFVFSFSFLPFDLKYIGVFLFILLFYMIFLLRIKQHEYFVYLSIIFSITFLLLQLASYNLRLDYSLSAGFDSSLLSSILFFIGCMAFPITYVYLCVFINTKTSILGFLKSMIVIVNSYFIIELVSRLLNYDSSEHSFYVFKSSVFYLDSNFIALILVSYFVFLLFLHDKKIIKVKYSLYLTVFLIIMTFSRSGWLVLLYLFLFLKIKNGRLNKLRFYIPVIISMLAFSSIYTWYKLHPEMVMAIDPSLNTKFIFLERAIEHVNQYGNADFFGLGLASSSIIYGRYFHNIIAIFIFEMGIIGTIVFLAYLLLLARIERVYVPVLIIVNLIMGMSLFSTNISYLFFFISLIVYLDRRFNYYMD